MAERVRLDTGFNSSRARCSLKGRLRGGMSDTFETALSARVAAMADACTRCGKCVEVCPVTGPGGVDAEPRAVIGGALRNLRTGGGPGASLQWAEACVVSRG